MNILGYNPSNGVVYIIDFNGTVSGRHISSFSKRIARDIFNSLDAFYSMEDVVKDCANA